MKRLYAFLLAGIAFGIAVHAAVPGYRNPILPYDYSDPDVIRVGDTYVMTSSSFNNVPGLQILASKDLVHWEIVDAAIRYRLPGYEEGLFYVQDRAARCAADVSGVQPGMRVLDVCAAPGGKSFAAALRMKNTGSILSCDIHEKKLRRIEQGAKRLGIDCLSVRSGDARVMNPAFQNAFDLVIADVPCSGLGVIGKRPEIRFKSEEELAALPVIQREILQTVSSYVRPGGVLLYSTCTILDAENRESVENFLKQNPNYSVEDFSIGEVHSNRGMHTFWPQVDGTDGFFVAKLRRRE